MPMSPLDKKKLEVELSSVRVGRESMELKIMEREDEIERIKGQIEIQTNREQELIKKLAED
jgi:hypothetical protein